MEEKYGHYNDDTEKKNRLGMNVSFRHDYDSYLFRYGLFAVILLHCFSNLYDIVRYIRAVYLPYMEYSEDIDCLLE